MMLRRDSFIINPLGGREAAPVYGIPKGEALRR